MKYVLGPFLATLACVSSIPAHAFEAKVYFGCAVADDKEPSLPPFMITSLTYTEEEVKEMDQTGTPENMKIKANVETFLIVVTPASYEPQPMLATKVKRNKKGTKWDIASDLGSDFGYISVKINGKKTVVDINFKDEINQVKNTNGPTKRYACQAADGAEPRSGN